MRVISRLAPLNRSLTGQGPDFRNLLHKLNIDSKILLATSGSLFKVSRARARQGENERKSRMYSWYMSILSSYSPCYASRSAADFEQVLSRFAVDGPCCTTETRFPRRQTRAQDACSRPRDQERDMEQALKIHTQSHTAPHSVYLDRFPLFTRLPALAKIIGRCRPGFVE